MQEGFAPVQSKPSTECAPHANANDHGLVHSRKSSETSPSDRVQRYGRIRPFVVDAYEIRRRLQARVQLRNRERGAEGPRGLGSRDQKSI